MATRIGDVLLSDGLLSEKALSRALELQAGTSRTTKLGSILLRWDLLGEADLVRSLAKLHRCSSVDWGTLSRADQSATRLLSAEQAVRLGAVPYAYQGKSVCVAFANPSNIAAVDEVQSITGRRVIPAVTSEVRLVQAHQRFYARPISRAFSTLLQKIESQTGAGGAAQPVKVDSPAATAPEHASQDVRIRETPGVDLTEVADSLLPLVDERWPSGEATEPGMGGAPESRDASARTAEAAPDPLADDGPLSKFLEGAIGYYGAGTDLEQALASIEVGPVEDLDLSMEEALADGAPEASPESFDETWPSRRNRRPRESGAASL